MRPLFFCVSATLLSLLLLLSSTRASERIFTYTYQSNVLSKGHREIEVWNTLQWQRENFYRRFLHRIEYEIGLGGNVQTAFYLNVINQAAFQQDQPSSIEKESEAGFSNEWKVKLSDPLADALGSSGYIEIGILADEIEFEGRIILDKQVGTMTHALNIVAEPGWETEASGNTTRSEFGLALEFNYGFSVQLGENWNLGLEARSHNEYKQNDGWRHMTLFAGPTASYRTTGWWATLTVLPQLYAFQTEPGNKHNHLELLAHERLETRLLFAYEF